MEIRKFTSDKFLMILEDEGGKYRLKLYYDGKLIMDEEHSSRNSIGVSFARIRNKIIRAVEKSVSTKRSPLEEFLEMLKEPKKEKPLPH